MADTAPRPASIADPSSDMSGHPGLDRWVLLGKLGGGAFSNVFRARDKTGEIEEVAIKVVRKHGMTEHQEHKLRKEIDIMRVVNHTNIVRLIDSLESPKFHYMIMEVCSSGELYEHVAGLPPFSESLSRPVITQVANAVQYLHETLGIVHRDIKLENILSCATPTPEAESDPRPDDARRSRMGTVKLTDFGLAKAIATNEPLMTPCGSAGYAAPEVYGCQKYSSAVDMWALGCVLYTMLAGFPPFYSRNLQTMTNKVLLGRYSFLGPPWNNVSDVAKDLIANLLTVNPADRFTIKDFLAHPWIRQEPDTAPAVRPSGSTYTTTIPPPALKSPPQRHRGSKTTNPDSTAGVAWGELRQGSDLSWAGCSAMRCEPSMPDSLREDSYHLE